MGFLLEEHDLLIRAARRCAYDLGHAASDVKDPIFSQMYHDAHYHWLDIFEKGGEGGKHYRHRLHGEISRLEFQIKKIREILKENNLEDPTKEIPF